MAKKIKLTGVKKAVTQARFWEGNGDIFPFVNTATGEVWVECCLGEGNQITYHSATIHCLYRYLLVMDLKINMHNLKQAAIYYIERDREVNLI